MPTLPSYLWVSAIAYASIGFLLGRYVFPRRRRGRPYRHCDFGMWSPHYIPHVHTAIKEYLSRHPELVGTATRVQMEDIMTEAQRAYARAVGVTVPAPRWLKPGYYWVRTRPQSFPTADVNWIVACLLPPLGEGEALWEFPGIEEPIEHSAIAEVGARVEPPTP